ncbi:hypothetical protein N9X07_02930 [Flavobacteriaceae bacterium]|nr:hypothetical protein [Flavobacteriaceae bacterium]
MIHTKQDIPSDLEGISKVDIEKWNENFNLPFKWSELIEIEDKAKSILNKHIKSNKEYYKIILISYKIFIEHSNFIYALLLSEKSASISKNNTYLYEIKNNGIPAKPIIDFPKLVDHSIGLKKKYRFLKRIILDNKFKLLNPFSKKSYLLTESRSYHTIEYLKKENKGIISPFSFFDIYNVKNLQNLSEKEKNEILALSSSIIHDLQGLSTRDYQLVFSKKQIEYLKSATFNVFSKSLITLNAVKKELNNKKIKLYLGSNNSFISRIISVAIRDNGGEIVGFSHGEPLIYDWDKTSWMELSLNDAYYEYTKPLADQLKKIHSSKFKFHNKVKIKSFNSDLFKKYYNRIEEGKNCNSPQKVMLIGNAYKEARISSVTAPYGIMQLQIEMEIINKLKEVGSKIIYKKHPGGYFSTLEMPFSKDKTIKVVDAPFETSFKEADVLIFYYTRTTTFGHALASKKKIIVVDTGVEVFPTDVLNTLKKQCFFIKAEIDSKNRFSLIEKDLQDAINDDSKKDVYFEEYLSNKPHNE